MSPKSLAGDKVLDSVPVNVDHDQRMKLRKTDAVVVLLRFVAHDGAFDEPYLAFAKQSICLRILRHLLEPRQSVSVGRFARYDVVVSVAVEIIAIHLSAARL